MTFGDVPTSVTSPPSRDANAIGIRRREAGVPDLRATCMAIGIMMASAPMFLVAIDRSITAPAKAGIWSVGVLRRLSTGDSTVSTTPERAMAALRTRAEAMIQMRSLLKPENISSTGTTPIIAPTTNAVRATRS